ncbi:MAG TPA: hypothetical protein ENJ95_23905 [Bacteroidetes bacterium]|nr:hypothetical protein [Bacteroidota bacterium]
MKELKHFDQIHAYAEGQMDSGQRQAFEKELTADAELRAEYDAFLASQKAMEVLAFEQLGKMMGSRSPGAGARDVKVVPLWRRAWAQAAAVLLLAGAGLLWYANSQYKNELLADAYYIEPNLSPARGNGNGNLADQAAYAFESGNIEEAIRLAASADPGSSYFQDAQHILGHAYLKNGQFDLAVKAFEKVTNPEWADDSDWHRALALLAAGRTDEAEKLLVDISNKNEEGYGKRADKLLDKLKSGWRKLVF